MNRWISLITFSLLFTLPLTNISANVLNRSDQFLDKLGEPISLGKHIDLKLGGQWRYRLELRDDFTFNDAAFEDDAINLLRTRLNATLNVDSWLSLFVEAQDSESFAQSGKHRSSSFVNQLDLHQLYVNIATPSEEVPLNLRIGRQKLSYADQRLIGAFEWSNVARLFDAVKLSYNPNEQIQFDAWFSQLVLVNRVKADSADHDENFYGLYATYKPSSNHTADLYLLMRHNRNNELVGELPGQRGQLKEYTLGNRLAGHFDDVDYGLEWAWQFGSRAHNDIEAWALHTHTGYTFSEVDWKPRIHAEFSHGSGDSDTGDGDVGNFDNLFPTNHLHYGYMDFASLRNMNDIAVGLSASPNKKVTLSSTFHLFVLDSNKSAWFNAGGGTLRSATPNASRSVGNEWDFLAKWKASKHLSILAGYSYFHAGPFVSDSGKSDDANFFYTQTLLTF